MKYLIIAEHQSAYRSAHSTETALIVVKSNIIEALDKKLAVLMVFLDLSAAFDSIDHAILLRRLSMELGFSDNPVSWLRSYLNNRISRVKVINDLSEPLALDFGVPQGSVIGPQLFTMYTSPIANIIKQHEDVQHHSYADDVQLFIAVDPRSPDSFEAGLSSLSKCITDLQSWMAHNMLKLNCSKTQFMVVANPHALPQLANISLRINNEIIAPSFDSALKMNHHVSSLCRSLHFHLCNIGRIRPFIDNSTCEKAVRSVVISRLDYSNSLLYGISSSDTKRLQRIQNRAAKLIFKCRKYDHATPLLHQLHWLPVHQRIVFKILTIVYKCLHNTTPTYLTSLIKIYHSGRPGLRPGSDITLLAVPTVHSAAGDRAFYAHAPRLWNRLPHQIRSAESLEVFKKHLKTFLFNG